ncbi:hypothetical protein [Acinetobacter rudis]|uniref:hypothetical protein n=1 Tax=Acinetobacter rudis TaxID=632955 RepID=UPI0033417C13
MKTILLFAPILVLTACAMSEPKGYYQDPVVKDNNVEEWKRWEAQKRIEADMRYAEQQRRQR